MRARIKILVNTDISIVGIYKYIENIWKRENYIKFMKILRKILKMTKLSKINILELFNITKLNL